VTAFIACLFVNIHRGIEGYPYRQKMVGGEANFFPVNSRSPQLLWRWRKI